MSLEDELFALEEKFWPGARERAEAQGPSQHRLIERGGAWKIAFHQQTALPG